MNKDGAMVCFTVGFLFTFGGVGGIENSINSQEMLGASLVAIVGLLVMGCGALAMRVLDNRG